MEELREKFQKEFEEIKKSLEEVEKKEEENLKNKENEYQQKVNEFNEKYSGEIFPTEISKRDEEQKNLEEENKKIQEERNELNDKKKAMEFKLQDMVRGWQKEIDNKREELVKKVEEYTKQKEKLESDLKKQKDGLKVWEEKGIKDQLYHRRKDVVIPKIEKQVEELNEKIEDSGIKSEWGVLGNIKSELKDLPLHTKDAILNELNNMPWLNIKTEKKQNVYNNINDIQNMFKDKTPEVQNSEPVEFEPETPELEPVVENTPEPVEIKPETPELEPVVENTPEPIEFEPETPELEPVVENNPEPAEPEAENFEQSPEEFLHQMFKKHFGTPTQEPQEFKGMDPEKAKILKQAKEKIEMLIPEFNNDKDGLKVLNGEFQYSLDAEGVTFNGKKYTFEELSEFEDKKGFEKRIKATLNPKDAKKLDEMTDDYIFKAMAKQCEDTIKEMIQKTESIIKDNPELEAEIKKMYNNAANGLIEDRYQPLVEDLNDCILSKGWYNIHNVNLEYDLRHMSVFNRMTGMCTLEKAEINKLTEMAYNLRGNKNVTVKVGSLTKIKFAIKDRLNGIKTPKITDGSENKKGIKSKVKDSYDKAIDRYTENRLYDGSKYPGGAKKAEAEMNAKKEDKAKKFRKGQVSGRRGNIKGATTPVVNTPKREKER